MTKPKGNFLEKIILIEAQEYIRAGTTNQD